MPATAIHRPGTGLYRLSFYGTCRHTGRLRTRDYSAPGKSQADIDRAEVRARRQLHGPRFVTALRCSG